VSVIMVAAAAHRAILDGHTTGKIALVP